MTAAPSPAPAPASAPAPAPGGRKKGRVRGDVPPETARAQSRLGMALVAPLVLMVVVFLLFPLANAFYYTFVDFNGLDASPPWVGLDNYTELAQDPDMWEAAWNNLIWIVLGTIGPLVIGLFLALLVWGVEKGSLFYRVVFFMPYVLPQVAVGVVWGWIFEPSRGWLNKVLDFLGLGSLKRGWLGDPETALYAVLATAIWATSAFVFIILLSALRNVDVDLVDASRLDGANSFQRLRYVILPQIMPVFLMVMTVTLIGGFAVFDIVFVMTGGGPSGASEVLGTFAYTEAFGNQNRISYGTTLALVIMVISVPFAIGLNRLQRRLTMQGNTA